VSFRLGDIHAITFRLPPCVNSFGEDKFSRSCFRDGVHLLRFFKSSPVNHHKTCSSTQMYARRYLDAADE
jgi:hypothetical protein